MPRHPAAPPAVPDDEPRLTSRMVELASEYGRYGYRRVTALLRAEGFKVNHKRVERLWRREGLKVPARQPRRGRLWLNDGSCARLRPERKDHVWSYDFVQARTRDGRALRMLTVIDEFTRECLAIDTARQLKSDDVLERLSDLFVRRGVPAHIRSDNGPEFTAKAVREWLGKVGVTTLYIEPGSPWENGYVESFNGKLRDELLDCEVFDTLPGGQGADRAVAGALQHGAAAQLAGVSAAGAGGDRALDAGPRGVAPETDRYGRGGQSTNITGGITAGGRSQPRLPTWERQADRLFKSPVAEGTRTDRPGVLSDVIEPILQRELHIGASPTCPVVTTPASSAGSRSMGIERREEAGKDILAALVVYPIAHISRLEDCLETNETLTPFPLIRPALSLGDAPPLPWPVRPSFQPRSWRSAARRSRASDRGPRPTRHATLSGGGCPPPCRA